MFSISLRRVAGASALATLLLSSVLSAPSFAESSVEVMHFWTTGGEAAALKVVKDIVIFHLLFLKT